MSILIKFAAAATFALSAVAAQAVVPVYPAQGTENAALYSFTAAATGTIEAYFAGSTAGYTEELGLLVNGVDSGVLGLNNKTTANGAAISFGSVTAGDTLTFFINVFNTSKTWFSDKSLNSDSINHVWSTAYAGGDFGIPAGTFFGFEDLTGGGDLNYNDEKFVFTNVKTVGSDVPEPAVWAMMIGGFGMIGAGLRGRRTALAA